MNDQIIQDEEEIQKFKNKLEALNRKLDYEKENGLRQKKDKRHPAEIALIGGSLMLASGLLHEGAFIGIYILGGILTVLDMPKLLGNNDRGMAKALKGQPLPYLAGGITVNILLEASGIPMPNPELGLLADVVISTLQFIGGLL